MKSAPEKLQKFLKVTQLIVIFRKRTEPLSKPKANCQVSHVVTHVEQ